MFHHNRKGARLAVVAAAIAMAFGIAGCSPAASPSPSATPEGETSSTPTTPTAPSFQSVQEGKLIVAATMPVQGMWNGIDAESLDGGVEFRFAQYIAENLGLELGVKQVQWTPLVSGTLADYDFGLNQIFRTEERLKVNNFTECYGTSPSGVLARADLKPATADDLRKLKLGTITGSFQHLLLEALAPEQEIRTYADANTMYAALANKSIDAVANDLAGLTGRLPAEVESGFNVVGTLASASIPDPCYAIQVPKTAPEGNIETLNGLIKQVHDDGSWTKWEAEYLPAEADKSLYPVIDIP